MKHYLTILLLLTLLGGRQQLQATGVWVEAERFTNKGGWAIDQQFMDLMGSPYLIAHGLGTPVADASTVVSLPEAGVWHVYVRTYNWTAPWHRGEGPGRFALSVDGKRLSNHLGVEGETWMWQYAGTFRSKKTEVSLTIHDLTGFDGRIDAVWFTKEKASVPPSSLKELEAFRHEQGALPAPIVQKGYDLVVAGAGLAGMSAAVAAARLGCKVALINDRPIVGGNNSSEVRVHLGGALELGKYPELGALQKEFGPLKEGNAQPAANYEDEKKMSWLKAEKGVTCLFGYRVVAVKKAGHRITSITAQNIETGEAIELEAPLFADCTGDATVGYLAGADFRMGREGREEFGEATAPLQPDSMTMGASIQWYSEENKQEQHFPEFNYGIQFNETNCEQVMQGEWTWETGMHINQITQAERIRDYGMMVVYANWSYLKNHSIKKADYAKRSLAWVAFIAGKRESRRLMGDYILKEDDLTKHVAHEDASFTATWSIDLHRPDPENSRHFPGQEFKATTDHVVIYPYPVPYRCLYSRNIDNLFMAGRNISVTHVALGTVRVMRTTGAMGEVVGMASAICRKHNILPRTVYWYHLEELKQLMAKGVAHPGLPNNQQYNEGGRLSSPPQFK